jgi:hypothetical protein
MITRTTTALSGLVLLALASGCDRQEAAWQEAREADTITAYEAYVAEYADGDQVGEAERRIRALRAAELWEQTREAETVEPYRRFLEQFPDSGQAEEARTRLEQINRQNEWATLRTSSDVDALRAFAARYAGQPVGQEAEQRVEELERAQAREQARLEAERAEEAARTHRVQLAALRSREVAQNGASALETRLASILGETGLEVEPSGNFYLIRTEPLKEPQARSLCERLQAQNQDCLVVSR